METPFEPTAGQHLTNTGGIEIMFSSSCDGVLYRYNYGQDIPDEPKEAEIEYFDTDTDGTPFDHLEPGEPRMGFTTDRNCRFYLDNFCIY